MRIHLLLAVVVLMLSAPSVHTVEAAGWTKDDLFSDLRKEEKRTDRFVERRVSAILTKVLVSRGTLVFTPPGRLERHVVEPVRENFIIDDGVLTIELPAERVRRQVDLQREPVLWAFIEAFRATLAGDLSGLEKVYSVELEGRRIAWRLRLTPRTEDLLGVVQNISIEGQERRISSITVRERSGDTVITTIIPEVP